MLMFTVVRSGLLVWLNASSAPCVARPINFHVLFHGVLLPREDGSIFHLWNILTEDVWAHCGPADNGSPLFKLTCRNKR